MNADGSFELVFDDGDRRSGVQASCIRALFVASDSDVVPVHGALQEVPTRVPSSDGAPKNTVELKSNLAKAALQGGAVEPGANDDVGINTVREPPSKMAGDASFSF